MVIIEEIMEVIKGLIHAMGDVGLALATTQGIRIFMAILAKAIIPIILVCTYAVHASDHDMYKYMMQNAQIGKYGDGTETREEYIARAKRYKKRSRITSTRLLVYMLFIPLEYITLVGSGMIDNLF